MRCICGRRVKPYWRDIVLTGFTILALGYCDVTFLERFALSVILFATIYL